MRISPSKFKLQKNFIDKLNIFSTCYLNGKIMNNLKRIFLNKQMLIYNFVNFDEKCLSFGSSVKKKFAWKSIKFTFCFTRMNS